MMFTFQPRSQGNRISSESVCLCAYVCSSHNLYIANLYSGELVKNAYLPSVEIAEIDARVYIAYIISDIMLCNTT